MVTGWVAVAAVVVVVDLHAGFTGRPMLSTSFRLAARRYPLPVTLAAGYLLAHLYGVLPSAVDPLSRLGAHRLV